jgi:hypothetical protein
MWSQFGNFDLFKPKYKLNWWMEYSISQFTRKANDFELINESRSVSKHVKLVLDYRTCRRTPALYIRMDEACEVSARL